MGRFLLIAAIAGAALLTPGMALGQAKKPPRASALQSLSACRALAGKDERLACYDREVAAVESAEARNDLVVVERQQLTKTRRSLFGLALPNLSIFGDDSPQAEGIASIETTIRKATQTPYGKWVLELEDGARWAQIDSRELQIDPKPGHPIRIRKGALGSYTANVKGQTGISVERLR